MEGVDWPLAFRDLSSDCASRGDEIASRQIAFFIPMVEFTCRGITVFSGDAEIAS